MLNTILVIFEGEKRENQYFKSLESHFFDEKTVLKCAYGNDIYELYDILKDDQDLDLVELIRESKAVPSNRQVLKDLSRDQIAQIFLMFDLEYQDEKFSFSKLISMLELFNQETDLGKLLISYPMVEALRDVTSFDEFVNQKVTIDQCSGKHYKKLSTQRGLRYLQDPRKITLTLWIDLIISHKHKAEFILNDDIFINNQSLNQIDFLIKQKNLIINEYQIWVFSAFPVFLIDYFGIKKFTKIF